MATLKQDWSTTRTLLGSELDSLADGAFTSGETAVDLGDPAPFALTCEAKLTGTAGSTGNVDLYALWSKDNTDFSDHDTAEQNGELIAVVDMLEATETIKIFQFAVQARYLKTRAKNASGAALAADAGDITSDDVQVDST